MQTLQINRNCWRGSLPGLRLLKTRFLAVIALGNALRGVPCVSLERCGGRHDSLPGSIALRWQGQYSQGCVPMAKTTMSREPSSDERATVRPPERAGEIAAGRSKKTSRRKVLKVAAVAAAGVAVGVGTPAALNRVLFRGQPPRWRFLPPPRPRSWTPCAHRYSHGPRSRG